MPLIPSQARLAVKCFLAQRSYTLRYVQHRREQPQYRQFTHTSRRQAVEDPDSVIAQLQSSPLMKKIADKPDALRALNDLAIILKELNIDMTPGRSPSMLEVFKLASNPKFRDGAKKVMEELNKAGVDINSSNALELFGLKKPPGQ